MAGDFRAGAVLDWDKFRFKDGTEKDKLLIVLGCKQGRDVLMVLATSKRHYRNLREGCHATAGYFFISAKMKWFFSEDTWVLLSDPVVLSAQEIVRAGFLKQARVLYNFSDEITRALCNCLAKGIDVSDYHRSLI